MATRECYHCKQEIEEGTAHDCWTTTEENLTRDLPEDLIDAWERLRETAAEFGDQRIYASHRSIMFSQAPSAMVKLFMRRNTRFVTIRQTGGVCTAGPRPLSPGCSRVPAGLRNVRGPGCGPPWSRKVFPAKDERGPFRWRLRRWWRGPVGTCRLPFQTRGY